MVSSPSPRAPTKTKHPPINKLKLSFFSLLLPVFSLPGLLRFAKLFFVLTVPNSFVVVVVVVVVDEDDDVDGITHYCFELTSGL